MWAPSCFLRLLNCHFLIQVTPTRDFSMFQCLFHLCSLSFTKNISALTWCSNNIIQIATKLKSKAILECFFANITRANWSWWAKQWIKNVKQFSLKWSFLGCVCFKFRSNILWNLIPIIIITRNNILIQVFGKN